MLPSFTANNQPDSETGGILYLTEPVANTEMPKVWYEIAHPDHFWFRWRFDTIRKLLPVDFCWGTLLDVGCGNGTMGKQIQDYYGVTAIGCDLDLDQLRSISYGYEQLYFYNIHDRKVQFQNYFSTILLMDVLEHIEDRAHFLNSVSFHLSPGGRLIINVPALQMFYSNYDKLVGHVRRYSIKSLKHEMELAGFQVERVGYWGMTLIPVLVLRKLILFFTKDQHAIKLGFQPRSLFIARILDHLRRLEASLFSRAPIGSSILLIAKKDGRATK